MSDRAFAELSGRRAVVTGASSGIGRAIARELARAGAGVVVHCRQSEARARELANEIEAAGDRAAVIIGDLGQVGQVEALFERAWACFGGADIWVNNAGVDVLTGEARQWTFERKLQRLLDVDVTAALLLSRLAGARMREAAGTETGDRAILNIGWDQADRGMEGDSGEMFSAVKNAVMGFTRSLAVSLAPHVRVNCIAPGWIRTKWGEQAGESWQERVRRETPLARWGTPEDIAAVARFLVSSEASFMTGQVVNVNGGAVR